MIGKFFITQQLTLNRSAAAPMVRSKAGPLPSTASPREQRSLTVRMRTSSWLMSERVCGRKRVDFADVVLFFLFVNVQSAGHELHSLMQSMVTLALTA